MEDTTHSNAGLMRRIVQLETEKDELHRDIEKLCTQQSGFSGSIGIVSRMQAWRSAGFEQELEACKQKLAIHTKDNLDLQEELSETYQIKSRVADALKTTMDKNKELEKEVKFYQSRMTAAFTERDKAYLELDKMVATEKSMTNEMKELQNRLKKSKVKYNQLQNDYVAAQQQIGMHELELKRAQQVVEKFWQLRESTHNNGDLHEDVVDKVQVLLEENDVQWVYGSVTNEKQESYRTMEVALNQAKDELEVSKHATTKLQEELSLMKSVSRGAEEDLLSIKSASAKTKEKSPSTKSTVIKLEEELSHVKSALANAEAELLLVKSTNTNVEEDLRQMTTTSVDVKFQTEFAARKDAIEREIQEVRVHYMSLKNVVSACLDSVKDDIVSLDKSLQNVSEKVKLSPLQPQRPSIEAKYGPVVGEIPLGRKSLRVHFADESGEVFEVEENAQSPRSKEKYEDCGQNKVDIDDSKEILAQALQEKVDALLLLSQQEERYYLEASTQAALEAQVTLLNQKLSQVTGEKVRALLELADSKQIIQQLQARQRELTQWLGEQNITCPGSFSEDRPSSIAGGAINQTLDGKAMSKTMLRFMPNGNYLKGWLRGLDLSGFKATSSDAGSSRIIDADAANNKSPSSNSVSRLLVENAGLQERLASLQHVAKAVHHLHLKLVKIASESQGQLEIPLIESAIKVIESVKSEAKELMVAPGCSLPLSFQGSPESIPDNSAVGPSDEIQDCTDQNSVAMAAMEMVESLLTVAELQTESLLAKLRVSHISQ